MDRSWNGRQRRWSTIVSAHTYSINAHWQHSAESPNWKAAEPKHTIVRNSVNRRVGRTNRHGQTKASRQTLTIFNSKVFRTCIKHFLFVLPRWSSCCCDPTKPTWLAVHFSPFLVYNISLYPISLEYSHRGFEVLDGMSLETTHRHRWTKLWPTPHHIQWRGMGPTEWNIKIYSR